MIIQEEYICKNGVRMTRTYSDAGVFIVQKETGIIYQEAYDSIPTSYTYEETDELINTDSEEAITEDHITALGEFGVMV